MPASCHQCGQPLPENSPGDGLCPSCLWHMLYGGDKTQAMPAGAFPPVAGHEIIEELAQGGMGVVYRARQIEPHREVALKMLLPLGSGREDLRERFRVEVRTLAELDHPGILPLYQVGETDDRPWFTMKLAVGGSLATRLKRKRAPSKPASAAALIAGLADAVNYAHEHGVLHRDIKPGNILFDERSSAFLADFGLAKITGSTADMTRTTAVMGTPCYMAPEVASDGAKAATVLSDIYGLGAVFYELLAGRPPFVVEGMAALVRKIIEDEPERPSTLADHVPRDLELICLTCMAKDPRRRYSSAAAIADDLRRWMRGEPIAARRAGKMTRLWAWSRRRPALAALSAALILTLAVGSAWLLESHRGWNAALMAENAALRAEEKSRGRADAQSEFLIGEFADSLEKMGRLELVQKACEKAAALDDPVDDHGRLRCVRLLNRWSAVAWAQGQGSTAGARCSEAIALLAALPQSPENLALAVEVRCRLAAVRADTTSFEEALSHLHDAENLVASPGLLPLDDALRLQAEVDRSRATLWNRLKHGETEALENAHRAVASFSAWQARNRDDTARTLALAAALRDEGVAWYRHGGEHPDPPDLEKALLLFKQGAAIMRALPDRSPAEDFELAFCAGWTGDCLLRMDGQGPVAARPWHEEEFQIISALAAQDPLNGHWQNKLAASHISLAELNLKESKKEEAASHRRQCLDILAKLHQRAPAVRMWTLNYVMELLHEGRSRLRAGDKDAARAAFKQCLAISSRLILAQPVSRTEQDGWYELHKRVGDAWSEAKEPAEAAAVFQDALAFAAQKAAIPGEAGAWWQWTLARMHRRMADTQSKAGDNEAALASNLAALELRSNLLRARHARAIEDTGAVRNVFEKCADLQFALGLPGDAIDTGTRAFDLFIACRKSASSPEAWADCIRHIAKRVIAKFESHAALALVLAERAAKEIFPPESRAMLPKVQQDAAHALEQLANPIPPK